MNRSRLGRVFETFSRESVHWSLMVRFGCFLSRKGRFHGGRLYFLILCEQFFA
ncbi:hypothetical protein MRBBS_0778 [Marinobacter sp. BSs20148]|nr:hypothetical protein MRBBS_0778 [Marinobacter sp. BSs20148]